MRMEPRRCCRKSATACGHSSSWCTCCAAWSATSGRQRCSTLRARTRLGAKYLCRQHSLHSAVSEAGMENILPHTTTVRVMPRLKQSIVTHSTSSIILSCDAPMLHTEADIFNMWHSASGAEDNRAKFEGAIQYRCLSQMQSVPQCQAAAKVSLAPTI